MYCIRFSWIGQALGDGSVLKDDLLRCGISLDAAVAEIKKHYPGFDKPMLSKAGNPAKYGVSLHSDCVKILMQAFPSFVPTPKDRHQRTCRISCRLDDSDYAALLDKLQKNGNTVQNLIESAVRDYIAMND